MFKSKYILISIFLSSCTNQKNTSPVILAKASATPVNSLASTTTPTVIPSITPTIIPSSTPFVREEYIENGTKFIIHNKQEITNFTQAIPTPEEITKCSNLAEILLKNRQIIINPYPDFLINNTWTFEKKLDTVNISFLPNLFYKITAELNKDKQKTDLTCIFPKNYKAVYQNHTGVNLVYQDKYKYRTFEGFENECKPYDCYDRTLLVGGLYWSSIEMGNLRKRSDSLTILWQISNSIPDLNEEIKTKIKNLSSVEISDIKQSLNPLNIKNLRTEAIFQLSLTKNFDSENWMISNRYYAELEMGESYTRKLMSFDSENWMISSRLDESYIRKFMSFFTDTFDKWGLLDEKCTKSEPCGENDYTFQGDVGIWDRTSNKFDTDCYKYNETCKNKNIYYLRDRFNPLFNKKQSLHLRFAWQHPQSKTIYLTSLEITPKGEHLNTSTTIISNAKDIGLAYSPRKMLVLANEKRSE